MERGKFIVFEGIDGSGKSTQIKLLSKVLKARGIICRETLEPTFGMVGGILHDILSGKVSADPKVTASLFVADRLDHILNDTDGILKSIESGDTVICDRYYFSSYAYQSVDVPRDWVISANRLAAETLRPDATIFIDISADTAMERIISNRENTELYETKERLASVREGYFSAFELLKDEERVFVVDGNRSIDEIAQDIEEIVINEIFKKG